MVFHVLISSYDSLKPMAPIANQISSLATGKTCTGGMSKLLFKKKPFKKKIYIKIFMYVKIPKYL